MTAALRTAAGLVLAGALAGCASFAPPPAAPVALTGRLAVSVEALGAAPARSVNANFELRGGARDGALDLSTPLGSLVAQARWSSAGATLTTPQGTAALPDLDTLAEQSLGERVPVAALFDWLRGRPWPGAPATPAAAPARGFEQLGWSVDLARFDDAVVTARRAAPPVVTVRARLEAP
jgi:outer membrane lipoprotein LolB